MYKKSILLILTAAMSLGLASMAIIRRAAAAESSPLDSAQTPPALTATDYGLALYSVVNSDGTSYEGWTGSITDGDIVSPRINLSDCKRPVLQFLQNDLSTTIVDANDKIVISYSEDGRKYHALNRINRQIILPQTTGYIKLHQSGSNSKPNLPQIAMICDMPADGTDGTVTSLRITHEPLTLASDGNPWPAYKDGNPGKSWMDFAIHLPEHKGRYLICSFYTSFTSSIVSEILEGHHLEKMYIRTDNKLFSVSFDAENIQQQKFILPTNATTIYVRYSSEQPDPPYWLNMFDDEFYKEDFYHISAPVYVSEMCYKSEALTANKSIPADKSLLYDVNGDGVLDWYRQAYILSLTDDGQGALKLARTGSLPSINGWIDYNNDGNIDILTSSLYSSNSALAFEDVTPIETLARVFPFASGWSLDDFAPVDYNADGCMDILLPTQQSFIPPDHRFVLTGKADGSLCPELIQIYTPDEWAGVRTETDLFNGPGNPLDMSGWIVSGSSAGEYVQPTFESIDLNGDGFTDLVNTATGLFMMNTGKNSFVSSSLGGKLSLRDFNGDGLMDYTSYSSESKNLSVAVSQPGGNHKISTLMSNLRLDKVWTYDFDHDGDVDILASTEYSSNYNLGYSYLIYFSNQSNGTFRRTETSLDGCLNFTDCVDINADGCYESIAQFNNKDTNYTEVHAYRIENDGTISTTPTILASGITKAVVADIRHSGKMQLITESKSGNSVIEIDGAVNTAPARPSAPTLFFDPTSSMLKVSWAASTDAETAAADLTYALRVGTAPGNDDIFASYALPTGVRRNLSHGNCGYALSRTFDVSSWKDGRYFIAVQAVDPNCRGSQFSADVVFEKKTPACDFTIAATAVPAVDEEVIVKRTCPEDDSVNYEWDWDDAEIISSEDDGRNNRIRFNTAGEKTLRLTAVSTDGQRHTTAHTIQVSPINVRPSTWSSVRTAIDLDEDGKYEIVAKPNASVSYYEMMSGDSEGKYSRIRNMFNETYSDWSYSLYPADINRDGKADLFAVGSGYGRALINEGNCSMIPCDIQKWNDNSNDAQIMSDLDNDGIREAIGEDFILKFTADYSSSTRISFKKTGLPAFPHRFVDYDDDGLIDALISSDDTFSIYKNNGDFTFSKIKDFKNYGGAVFVVADIDSDGLTDILTSDYEHLWGAYTKGSEYLYIYWGDGGFSTVQCLSGHPFGTYTTLRDFDNNGYPDIVFKDSFISFYPGKKSVVRYIPSCSNEVILFRIADGLHGGSNYLIQCARNTAPIAPTNLRYNQNRKGVVIEWDRASDAETPAKALKYNISIKRKGVEGEGAYFYSPLNSGRGNVPLPNGIRLLSSNRITIPASIIPAGEYEIMVQAVDGMQLQSDFSEVMEMVVAESASIDVATATMVGKTEDITVYANYDIASIDLGDGAVIESSSGNKLSVHWTSEGSKIIRIAGKEVARIIVHPEIDATFVFPAKVLLGAQTTLPASTTHRDTWEIADSDGEYISIYESDAAKPGISGTDKRIIFNREGTYSLRRTLIADYGSVSYTKEVIVSADNALPAISGVTCDVVSGHYLLTWEMPEYDDITGVNIYKETSRLNEYELIGSTTAESNSYIDPFSEPSVKAARYKIAYTLTYGESALSTAHQPIHVMINQGVGNAINLMWSKYEGRDVTSYRILRGTSPDNIEPIAEVSGNMSSYSDLNRPSDNGYYAVEILQAQQRKAAAAASQADSRATRSNVVCTADAYPVSLVNQIIIAGETGSYTIDCTESMTLQLNAITIPANATYSRVNWYVSEGEDVVSVNRQGRVSAKASGSAKITAMSIDGSEVSATATITVINYPIPAESIILSHSSLALKTGETATISATVKPTDATDQLVWTSSDKSVVTVSDNGTVTAGNVGTAIVTATCGKATAQCTVTVSPQSGIQNAADGDGKSFNVYNLQGILIKADCDNEALRKLAKGTYIIVTPAGTRKITI